MKLKSRQMALCGMLCALAEVVLLLGGIFPLATFCAPMLAMVVLLPVLSECGSRMAAAAYGTVALLALLLVPDREMSLIFLFFGWYPLLQPKLLRLPSRLLRLICKLFFCNGAIALAYGLLLWVFQLGDLAESTPLLNAILVVCGNITFLLLDRVLVRLERLWRQTLRHKFFPHA